MRQKFSFILLLTLLTLGSLAFQASRGLAQDYLPTADSNSYSEFDREQSLEIGARYVIGSNRNWGFFDTEQINSSGTKTYFELTSVTDGIITDEQLRDIIVWNSSQYSAPQRAEFDPSANRLPEMQQVQASPRVAPQDFSGDENSLRRIDQDIYSYDSPDTRVELASFNTPAHPNPLQQGSPQQNGPAFTIKQQVAEVAETTTDINNETQLNDDSLNGQSAKPAHWQPEPSQQTPAIRKEDRESNLSTLDREIDGAVDEPPQVYGPAPSPELVKSWNQHESVSHMTIGQVIETSRQKKIEIESSTELNEEARLQKLERINSAHQAALNASQFQEKKLVLETKIANFEPRYQELKDAMSRPTTPRELAENITTDQLQAQLRMAQQELADRKNSLQQILDAVQQQAHRAAAIPVERAEANKKLSDIRQELASKQIAGQGDVALMVLIRAQELATEARLELLQQESTWLGMASQLLPLEQDIATRVIKGLKTEITTWDKSLGQLRRAELQAEINAARQNAVDAHPALKSFAQRTTELAQQRASLTESIERVGREKFEVQTQSHDLEEEHKHLEYAVNSVGTPSNGSLMIEVRRTMPLPFESHARIQEVGVELQSVKLAAHRLNEERKALGDPHEFIVNTLGIDSGEDTASTNMREMALEFVETQREQIDELTREYNEYIRLLNDVVEEREKLKSQISATRKFIDKNALWIPSAKRIGYLEVVETRSAIRTFFDRNKWMELGSSIVASAMHKPYGPALGLCGLFLVVFVQRRLKP